MAATSNNNEDEELSEADDESRVSEASNDKESSNPRPKKRRESVCAEKVGEENTTELKVIEKSESEQARIRDILNANMFFSHLDQQQLKAIQDAMFSVEHADGEVIIRQGDEVAENFFCIDSGCVEIFINSGNERKLVKTCQAGDSFGELALLYGSPRAASCVCNGDVKLWALNRACFKKILMSTAITVRNANKSFLEMVTLFSNLDEYELLTISDALHEERFEDSEAVCSEGENGDKFYLIKEGNAICTKKQSDGSVKEINRLRSGEYFGEIALLTEKQRQATVTAEGSLVCLSIHRDTFNRLLCIKQLLLKHIGTYNDNI